MRMPFDMLLQARPLLKQALEDGKYDVLVDPLLRSYYNPIELGRMVACAYACLHHSASLRPSMSQVICLTHHIPFFVMIEPVLLLLVNFLLLLLLLPHYLYSVLLC